MKRSELDHVGEALRRRKLPREDVDASIGRVWRNLRPDADAAPQEIFHDLRPVHPALRRSLRIGFATAAIASVAFVLYVALWPRGPFAVVESGALEGVVAETRVRFGDILRSNDGIGAVLRLTDGSRIEMRSQSEIRLESADDGVQIRLNNGSVIVTAAPQRSGHLYVQTRDVTVSAIGTVFLVNAEAEGSRVAVIEGQVRVRQGAVEKKLLPGEQVATAPSMGSLSFGEGISWSRNAESHLALLQRSVVALPRASSTQLEFEAATIKPSAPDSPPISITSSTGRLLTSNTSLRMLITWAYDISSDRLIGPNWLDDVRYDVHATVPAREPGEEPGRERLKLMMQSLLAERFKLLFHRETRDMAMYALAVDKKGAKVRLRDAGNDLGRNTFNMPGSGRLVGTKVTTGMLAKVLAEQLGREVEDRTGLSGIFDFTLEWAPDSDSANVTGRPSIFTAVREQLGLELLARKAPVEVLVIDQIERSPVF